jgi:hypothetical protein
LAKLPFDDEAFFKLANLLANAQAAVQLPPTFPAFAFVGTVSNDHQNDLDKIARLRAAIPSYESLGETRKDRIEALWQVVETSSVWRWLNKQPGWQAAWGVFEKKRARSNLDTYRADLAPFRFLDAAGMSCAYHVLSGGRPLKHPNAIQRHKAQGIVARLLVLFGDGLHLGDYGEHRQLRDLLEKLDEQLATVSPRRSRLDSTAGERQFVETVTRLLMRRFNEAPPTVIEHLCGIIGYEVDRRNIARHIRSAKARSN